MNCILVNKEKAKMILENIFLAFFCVYLFLSFQENTFLKFGIPKVYFDILLSLLLLISLVKFFVLNDSFQKKAMSILCLMCYLLSYYLRNMQFMAFLGVITFGCQSIKYKKILKCSVVVTGLLILTTIFMYLTSLMPYNNIFLLFKDGNMRSGLGLWYPTGSATMILIYLLSIYVLFNNINVVLQIFLGLISLFFASTIMNSKTSTICSIIFILLVCNDYAKNKFVLYGRIWANKEKYYKWVIIFLFPILAVIMYTLVIHYGMGYEYAEKIDAILDGRISLGYNAFKNYRLLPFGDMITLVGGGAVEYDGYNYIDSSYIYIPYMNGYLIYIITCFSIIYMTYKAYRIQDKKLVIAIIVVLINSFMEERLNNISYNIFIVLPLANFILSKDKCEKKSYNYSKRQILFAMTFMILFLLALPTIFSYIRTFSIMYELYTMSFIIFFVVMLCYVLVGFVFYSILKRNIVGLLLPLFILIAMSIFVNKYLTDGAHLYEKKFKYEDEAMNLIISKHKKKIYVCDLPVLYKRRYKNISYSILNQYELSLLRPNTVIMQTGDDSNIFHGFGYYICYISKDHMVYTLDENVIESLKNAGYKVEKFNYINRVLNKKEIAYENKLITGPSDCIYLDGSTHSIRKGPNDCFTYAGDFEMNLNLEIIDFSPYSIDSENIINSYSNNVDVCEIVITTYNGKKMVYNKILDINDFIDNNLDINFNYHLENVSDVEYKIIVNDGYKLCLNNISYRRTN